MVLGGIEQLRRRLANGPALILDGAVGTELTRRGFDTSLPLWAAGAQRSAEGRNLVRQIHADYVAAGADIVVANTFRGNLLTQAERMTAWDDVCGACQVDRPVWAAVSIGPLEDCYRPDLVPETREIVRRHKELLDGYAAVPLAWIETMGSLAEIGTVATLRSTGRGCRDYVISLCLREDGALLSGDSLSDAVALLELSQPLAIGVNCLPPSGATRAVRELRKLTDLPLAVYAHIGNPEPTLGWSFSETMAPEEYARHAGDWLEAGARIIGGCCGTTPEHIAALAALTTT